MRPGCQRLERRLQRCAFPSEGRHIHFRQSRAHRIDASNQCDVATRSPNMRTPRSCDTRSSARPIRKSDHQPPRSSCKQRDRFGGHRAQKQKPEGARTASIFCTEEERHSRLVRQPVACPSASRSWPRTSGPPPMWATPLRRRSGQGWHFLTLSHGLDIGGRHGFSSRLLPSSDGLAEAMPTDSPPISPRDDRPHSFTLKRRDPDSPRFRAQSTSSSTWRRPLCPCCARSYRGASRAPHKQTNIQKQTDAQTRHRTDT